MRVVNQIKTRAWEDSSLCPETSTKNAIQEFHLRRGWVKFFTPPSLTLKPCIILRKVEAKEKVKLQVIAIFLHVDNLLWMLLCIGFTCVLYTRNPHKDDLYNTHLPFSLYRGPLLCIWATIFRFKSYSLSPKKFMDKSQEDMCLNLPNLWT